MLQDDKYSEGMDVLKIMDTLKTTKIAVLLLIALFITAGVGSLADYHHGFRMSESCPMCKFAIDGISYSLDLGTAIIPDADMRYRVVFDAIDSPFTSSSKRLLSLRAPPLFIY